MSSSISKKSPLTILLILLTLSFVILGCGLIPKAEPTPAPTPTPKPIPTPAPGSTALTITEKDANASLQNALGMQEEVKIEGALIDFQPDRIFITGKTQLGALSIQLGLTASVTSVEGKAKIDIVDVQVNGKKASGVILEQIESLIDPILEQLEIVEDQFYVESVTITDDQMVIIGHQQ